MLRKAWLVWAAVRCAIWTVIGEWGTDHAERLWVKHKPNSLEAAIIKSKRRTTENPERGSE